MAKVNKAVWKEFEEVNSLFEMGRLKEQKVSRLEKVQVVIFLMFMFMLMILSFTSHFFPNDIDEQVNTLSAIEDCLAAIRSWMSEDKFALQPSDFFFFFQGDFEKLHEFKKNLKRLK